MEITTQEIQEARSKYVKESCCHSYETSKGRCFTCPDWEKMNKREDQYNHQEEE